MVNWTCSSMIALQWISACTSYNFVQVNSMKLHEVHGEIIGCDD